MLNALSIRTVLGLLVLAAPVMAIIPPGIDLQLSGAQQLSSFEYSVQGGDKVALSVVAKAGRADLGVRAASSMRTASGPASSSP